MFDRDGEFIDGAEPAPIEDVKADLRHISDKEKAYDRGWDPFKTQEKVKRDEFGFIIRKDDEGGLGTRDLSSARKSLWEIQKDLEKKRKKDMAQAGPANQNIINYPSAKEFFAKNQMKRFIVKGSYSHLPFSEKSKIEIMKACKPPFVLKFARDKIRLKKRVTSRKAIELIFEVYNMGYLVPTK